MLKEQVISNTWECDSCHIQSTAQNNPFYNIVVSLPSGPNTNPCSMDLCQTCVKLITLEPVADLITSLALFPSE